MEAEVIPVLHVADAAAAIARYGRLGFTEQWVHRFDPDCPAFASIARGRARLFLSEHRGDARPGTLIARGRARLFLSEHRGDARPGTLVVLEVSDVDAVVAEFGRPDGEPPYGCELELRDLDGNRLRISRQAS